MKGEFFFFCCCFFVTLKRHYCTTKWSLVMHLAFSCISFLQRYDKNYSDKAQWRKQSSVCTLGMSGSQDCIFNVHIKSKSCYDGRAPQSLSLFKGGKKINKCQSKLSGYAIEDRRRGQQGTPPGPPHLTVRIPFTFILHWDPSPCPRLLSHWGSKLFQDKKNEDILDRWLVLISSLWLHQSAGLWNGISHVILWGSVCH